MTVLELACTNLRNRWNLTAVKRVMARWGALTSPHGASMPVLYLYHSCNQPMNSLPRHNEPFDGDRLDAWSGHSHAQGNFDSTIVAYLYLIESNRGGLYKIGITSDPDRRMRELQPRQVLALVEVYNARSVEKCLHAEYSQSRLAGTEYFELGEEDIEGIISTIEFGFPAVDASSRLVPTTVKEGIEFALEYQKRHGEFWEICMDKTAHEMNGDLDPVEATKLELRYQEAFEELQEYIDACWSFRGYAYDGPIEGALKATQLILAYHQYRISKGIDEPDDDLEPREWNESLLHVQEWKKAGLSPNEMMNRSHEMDHLKTKEALIQINKSISDQAANSDNTSHVSDNTSPGFTEKFRRGMRIKGGDSSIRRANALKRWREKGSN